jgi:carbon monoxide dehydrogenase subunit G
MPFKIQERFTVQAPVERVWEYMIDPTRVVVCIPGAELLESESENTFQGAVKVKVGPIATSFKGHVKFTEIDQESHRVRIVGDGRDAGGAGSAKVIMSNSVIALPDGGAEVVVDAEVDLVGKIVQFGRGMIEEVSRQLFKQFSSCVKQQLETGEPSAKQRPPVSEAGVTLEEPGQPAGQGKATVSTTQSSGLPPVAKPVSGLSLAFRAIWAIIVRSVKRIFGRQ